jgi:hypothetical protein
MYESRNTRLLRLSDDAQNALIAAARTSEPVRGLTHGFYKYPARFSPVLDPHVGGGTTLVEALAAGREGMGVDISTLAEFVSTVKCTVYSGAELDRLDWWSDRVANAVDIHRPSVALSDYEELGYYKHPDHPSR